MSLLIVVLAACNVPKDGVYRFNYDTYEETCVGDSVDLWLDIDSLDFLVQNPTASGYDFVVRDVGIDAQNTYECVLDGQLYSCSYQEEGDQLGFSVDMTGVWESPTEAESHVSVLYYCIDGGLSCVVSSDGYVPDESWYPCGAFADGTLSLSD